MFGQAIGIGVILLGIFPLAVLAFGNLKNERLGSALIILTCLATIAIGLYDLRLLIKLYTIGIITLIGFLFFNVPNMMAHDEKLEREWRERFRREEEARIREVYERGYEDGRASQDEY
jgi:hypothetical protein